MDLIRLHMENFMGYRSTSIDFTDFQTALIVGKSKNDPRESNGVGKTTIFYAIEYGFFGTFPTSVINNIIRDGCDQCKVILDFSVGTSIYRIERTRNKKTSYLRFLQKRGDSWEKPIKLTQKTSTETQTEIIKTIKINVKAFRNSVLFAQADLEGLASAKPEARRGILKEALSLDVYSKYEKVAKELRDKVAQKLTSKEEVRDSLGDPEADIVEIDNKIEENRKNILELEKDRDSQKLIMTQKRGMLSDIQHLISSEVSTMKDKLTSILSSKDELQTKINSIEKNLSIKSDTLSSNERKISSKEASITNKQEKLNTLKLKDTRSIDQIKSDLSKVRNNENELRIIATSCISKVKDLSQPFPEGDVCSHCRQSMTPEHRENCLEQIDKEISSIQDKIKATNKKIEKVVKKKEALEKELRDSSTIVDSIKDLTFAISSLKNELDNDRNYSKQVSDIKSSMESDLALASQKLSELEKREKVIRDSLDEVAVDDINAKVVSLSNQIERIEETIKDLLHEISSGNTLEGVLSERKNNKLEDLKKIKEINIEIAALKKEFALRQKVVRAFSASGIPTMIIHTILDDLQIESNRLLSDLKPGLELQFSIQKEGNKGVEETLEMAFIVHGREREYAQISGGQKLLFALALKLGLSLIIQRRLGVDIKFLELDEVDAMLDKSAVDAFSDVIKKWQKFFKILVITHNDGLKDKFDYAILVEGDENNGSTAKVVNSW